jgi:hypothetical protein
MHILNYYAGITFIHRMARHSRKRSCLVVLQASLITPHHLRNSLSYTPHLRLNRFSFIAHDCGRTYLSFLMASHLRISSSASSSSSSSSSDPFFAQPKQILHSISFVFFLFEDSVGISITKYSDECWNSHYFLKTSSIIARTSNSFYNPPPHRPF